MAKISSEAVSALTYLLTAKSGLTERIAQLVVDGALMGPPISAADIAERYIAADLAEKTSGARYPSVNVYCEKVVNELREKFRRFSGTVSLVIEIRVSHEHMDDLQSVLQTYAETVTDILDGRRGSWGAGLFYTGGYVVHFGPIKRGGRNFLQSAKVELTLNASME